MSKMTDSKVKDTMDSKVPEEKEPFSESNVKENALFDDLMEEIGSNGYFQKRFNFIYNFLVVIILTMPYLNILFILMIPEHWCQVPGREFTNYTLEEWKDKWLPRTAKSENQTFSSCTMYTDIDTRENTTECQYGFEYDRQWFTETVPSELDWVCDKEIYISNSYAAGRVGEIVGTFIFGQLGDRYGRKLVFYLAVTIFIVGRILTIFVADYYYLFLFSIMLGSLGSTNVFQSSLVISMEVSDENMRSNITFLQCLGWVIGLCIMTLFSWLAMDWKLIIWVTTLPSLVCFFIYKLLPESPRWLASRGRVEEAAEVLKYIAGLNKSKIPKNTYSVLEKIGEKKDKFYGLPTLFANWRLAKNTIIIVNSWTVSGLCYYVITLSVTAMSGNPFTNFLWQSLVELPGYVLGKVLSEKIGRRWTQSGAYMIGSIFCVMTITAQSLKAEGLVIIFVALIKLALTTTFYMVWLQACEIYPTCVRQTGTAIGGILCHIVMISGPYIVYLGTSIDTRIPYIFLLGLIFMAGVSASFLPETLHEKLPETLEDAKAFGKNQKFWFIPINKK